jgi:hypothetical protein
MAARCPGLPGGPKKDPFRALPVPANLYRADDSGIVLGSLGVVPQDSQTTFRVASIKISGVDFCLWEMPFRGSPTQDGVKKIASGLP